MAVCSDGLCIYGLYSYGLSSYGLYGYGLAVGGLAEVVLIRVREGADGDEVLPELVEVAHLFFEVMTTRSARLPM